MKTFASLKAKISPELKYTLLMFTVTRAVLTIIGVSARIILTQIYGDHYLFSYSGYLGLDIWSAWDSGWYLELATYGYSQIPSSLSGACCGQANFGFFPLYPLLIRIVGNIVGNYYVAALLISNIALIIAAIFLYKLVRLNSSRIIARATIKYLFLFPTAFILSGIFADSLFLALILICFYYAKKKGWFQLGLYGFFLSLTKSLGIIMVLPFFYEYLKSKSFRLRKINSDSIPLLLIPLGILAFIVYTYFLTGDFFAYLHIKQSAWGVQLSNPVLILIRSLLVKNAILAFIGIFTIAEVLFLTFYYKKLNVSYRIASLLLIVVPLMSGWASFISMPRHFLAVFPFYILLAKLSKNAYFNTFATVLLALLQVVLMIFWSNGLLIV